MDFQLCFYISWLTRANVTELLIFLSEHNSGTMIKLEFTNFIGS